MGAATFGPARQVNVLARTSDASGPGTAVAPRGAMLRITVEPSPTAVRLRLEGNIGGAWVSELEDCWRSTSSSLGGRPLCLDLTAVERVDMAGRYLLALMRRDGTQLIASGALMTELVRSLEGDWPLTDE